MNSAVDMSTPFNLKRRFALTSLAVITAMALSLSWLLSDMLTQRMLQREGEVSMDFIQNLLLTDDSARFLVNANDPELRARFLKSMAHIATMRDPVRANAYKLDGTVAWSTDDNLVGKRFTDNDELQEALSGRLVIQSGDTHNTVGAKPEHEGLAQRASKFVESYIPIRDPQSSRVVGAMELYKTPARLTAAIHEGQLYLWAACGISGMAIFLALYWIVARADRTLRAQQARLAEAQSLTAAVELSSAVAHNLRNPLASIRVAAEMLQGSEAPLTPAELLEYCQDITVAVDRADRWITELVRVSQATQLLPEPVALGPLVRACFEEMGAEMELRNIFWHLPEQDAGRVQAHNAMLRQVILSIIANAVDAMPQGGLLRGVWRADGTRQLLQLIDNGHGISEDTRKRLFRPFFSTKSGGLGIGLALVKRVVEQWHGSVTLSAALPHGTCVEISLPRAD
jgi:two-component system, NtrC family, sensor histidine kinase HydH